MFSTKSMYVFQEINIFIKFLTEVSNNTKILVFYECTYRNSAKFSTKKKVRNIYATINVALLLSFFVQGLFWNYFFVAFSSFLPNVPDSRAGELWQKVANRGKIR